MDEDKPIEQFQQPVLTPEMELEEQRRRKKRIIIIVSVSVAGAVLAGAIIVTAVLAFTQACSNCFGRCCDSINCCLSCEQTCSGCFDDCNACGNCCSSCGNNVSADTVDSQPSDFDVKTYLKYLWRYVYDWFNNLF